jgi:hypothetical protein
MTENRAAVFQPDPVNGFEVLDTLAALPISKWSYVWDGTSVRHLGPMSQDFMAAFGLGNDDTKINLVDANGVVMVSVQALYRRLAALEARVAELEAVAGTTPATSARG